MTNSFLRTARVNNIYPVFSIQHNILWYFATEMKTKNLISCHGDYQRYYFSILELEDNIWPVMFFLKHSKCLLPCFTLLWLLLTLFKRKVVAFFAEQKRITVVFKTTVLFLQV